MRELRAFEFLRMNRRQLKPRTVGLTKIATWRTPSRVWHRYQGLRPEALTWHWRDEVPISVLPAGRALVVEDRKPFNLHVGFDGWKGVQDITSQPLGLGMHGRAGRRSHPCFGKQPTVHALLS